MAVLEDSETWDREILERRPKSRKHRMSPAKSLKRSLVTGMPGVEMGVRKFRELLRRSYDPELREALKRRGFGWFFEVKAEYDRGGIVLENASGGVCGQRKR